MRAAERAWVALAVGVAAYEVMASDGELLSHAFDRWLDAHPVLTFTAVGVIAAHLLNLLPDRADPFVWMSHVGPRPRRRR